VELRWVRVLVLLPLLVARSRQPDYRSERGNNDGAPGLPRDVREVLPSGVGGRMRCPAGASVCAVHACLCLYFSPLDRIFAALPLCYCSQVAIVRCLAPRLDFNGGVVLVGRFARTPDTGG